MPLSPVMQKALKAITKVKPKVHESLHQQRTIEDAVGSVELGDPRVRVDRHLEKLSNGKEVLLLIFTPQDRAALRTHGRKTKQNVMDEDLRGTIFFIHGGGWVTGNVKLYNDACKQVALALNRRLVSIDYPLSPEAKFPEALEECYEVYERLAEGRILREVNPEHVGVFGDSAGGNLAAALSLMARDKGGMLPNWQILLYPVLYNDYSLSSPFPSVEENGYDYLLTAEDCREYLHLYTKDAADLTSPYLAPLLAKSFSGLPKTLVMSAEYCPLRDEDETYVEKLLDAGTPVMGYRILDAIHGYMINPYMKSLMIPTLSIMKHFLDGDALINPQKKEDSPWLKIADGTNSTT